MTEQSLIILQEFGVDVEGTMARFCGKIEMYQRFLTKFLNDKSYPALCEALEKKDYENAIFNVHTLKGISGDLGFMKLMEVSVGMLTDLRAQKYDNLDAHTEAVKREYERVKILINKILEMQ